MNKHKPISEETTSNSAAPQDLLPEQVRQSFGSIILIPTIAISLIVFALSFLEYPTGSVILLLFIFGYPLLLLVLWATSAIYCRKLKHSTPNQLTNKEIAISIKYVLIALAVYLLLIWRYSFKAIEV